MIKMNAKQRGGGYWSFVRINTNLSAGRGITWGAWYRIWLPDQI
jgi:hypothetical protein